MAVPRNYHSMSLLLADGTVYTGGGGLCPTAFGASDGHCNRAIDHPNGGVFTHHTSSKPTEPQLLAQS